MPAPRAAALLRDWAADEPWKHYAALAQQRACRSLCMRGNDAFPMSFDQSAMPEREVEAKVATLRDTNAK